MHTVCAPIWKSVLYNVLLSIICYEHEYISLDKCPPTFNVNIGYQLYYEYNIKLCSHTFQYLLQ